MPPRHRLGRVFDTWRKVCYAPLTSPATQAAPGDAVRLRPELSGAKCVPDSNTIPLNALRGCRRDDARIVRDAGVADCIAAPSSASCAGCRPAAMAAVRRRGHPACARSARPPRCPPPCRRRAARQLRQRASRSPQGPTQRAGPLVALGRTLDVLSVVLRMVGDVPFELRAFLGAVVGGG